MKEVYVHPNHTSTVDDDDYEEVSRYKWRIDKDGYAIAWSKQVNGRRKLIRMHRLVANVVSDSNVQVDHIDHNKLNNCRSNLRVCSQSQNQRNRSSSKKSSIYKGVYKERGKYRARIFYNGKNIHIGMFSTENECARAYNKKAIELYGAFAKLNEIRSDNTKQLQ